MLSPYDRRAGESTRADRRLSCLMTAVEFPATKERPRALCVMLPWAARRDGLAAWVLVRLCLAQTVDCAQKSSAVAFDLVSVCRNLLVYPL